MGLLMVIRLSAFGATTGAGLEGMLKVVAGAACGAGACVELHLCAYFFFGKVFFCLIVILPHPLQ
jgi:hypothetical protein